MKADVVCFFILQTAESLTGVIKILIGNSTFIRENCSESISFLSFFSVCKVFSLVMADVEVVNSLCALDIKNLLLKLDLYTTPYIFVDCLLKLTSPNETQIQ